MYKLLLCWRYLRTRYLALVCVISVMLGVATLIVVNSVMAGFSTKLRDSLHGLLADVTVESVEFEGFADPMGQMRRIQQSPAAPHIEAISPMIETFAMLQFDFRGATITKAVKLVGVDALSRAAVGGWSEYLRDREGRRIAPSFELSEEAKFRLKAFAPPPQPVNSPPEMLEPGAPPPPEDWIHEKREMQGIIVGQMIGSFRDKRQKKPGEVEEVYTLEPGDSVMVTCAGGAKLAPVFDRFAVAGYFKSELSEYDGNYVFVPLEHLQALRGMQNRASSLQIKLKDYGKAKFVVEELRKLFPTHSMLVQTWEDKQGPLLSAIAIERGILNVLLFMIVGVAGFGILAIFSMIVVEKTRDIGILKALGASNRGIMSIFLGYGMLLGAVGAGLGTIAGLSITHYLNEIERFLSAATGQTVFDRSVYYFDKIPTYIQTSSVVLVNAGSMAIAVLFSVLPALRAAMLQPVRALRYE